MRTTYVVTVLSKGGEVLARRRVTSWRAVEQQFHNARYAQGKYGAFTLQVAVNHDPQAYEIS
jgi:hypothetical protein